MPETMSSLQPTPMPSISPFAAHIRRPGQPVGGTYIPSPTLELAVQAFLIQHQIPEESAATPRSILIQGPPGAGKTEVTLRAALTMGVAVMLLPPSVFSSKHEGGGVEAVTDALHEAERFSRANKLPITVMFDDIDHSTLSVGENTGHTVNTGDMVGHLQALSSNRTLHVTHTGLPIPFLATANAADRIAPSLFRQMRAKVVTHTVDDTTKLELAHTLFAPQGSTERAFIDKLFRRYRTESIAFWPALHSDYRAARIQAVIRAKGFNPAEVRAELSTRRPLDTALITKLADTCRTARPMNFLWTRKPAA